MFTIDVQKVTARVSSRELITTGSVGCYDVSFEFDEIWNDLFKTACFKAGNCGDIYEVLVEDDQCQIPWEVTAHGNEGKSLLAGVQGTKDGVVVVPTIWVSLGIIRKGVKDGESTAPPSPDIYNQIVDQLGKQKIHNNLDGRDQPDAHPIEAISGVEEIQNIDIFNMWNNRR